MFNLPKRRGRPPKTPDQSLQDQNLTNQSDPNESQAESIGSSAEKKPKRASSKLAWSQQREILAKMLNALLNGAGGIVATRDQYDGAVIVAGTPRLVEAILQVADNDKVFRLYIITLIETGVYANVAIAALAIVLPIAMHHNLIPPLFGPSPKAASEVEQGIASNGYATESAI